MNCLACFAVLVAPATQDGAVKVENSGATFGISLLIMLVGIPVSFVFWYRSLYKGVKFDRSMQFFLFFFNFVCHLGAMILLCIGIPGWGGS